ncbi:hypothetical protein MKX08_006414 [Trichoderma sp. CBMAI-0020]|nr:hypothetical protein MKX08_006414 [Trichoderma sp. CBMAI-0020]
MSKHSIILFLCCITIIVNASGLDDFSNNLASDLGPLLSLLGEAATIQYLSESTQFIDYFILAMAPIGIISTVTAVIRLCGNSTLRAFIGKAQEGESRVEAELCTSTSADVCELFDKGGITRVFGRPDIMEIIYIPAKHNAEPKFHLFTQHLQNNEGNIHWSEIPKNVEKGDAGSQSANSDSKRGEFAPKPNISLNVGIKRPSTVVLYIVAAIGFILQSGVIIFAGIGPWLLDWNAQKLSSEASQDYAPGIFIAGTVALCLGIWGCAVLVGQTTHERTFQRGGDDPSTIYWLQPGQQVVGDQTFYSFIYSDKRNTLKTWTSSTKIPQKNYHVTYVAVSFVILGYIAQFIGLRGLNAWISIAQLAITLVMSILRGALRMRRLNKDDNLIQSPFEKHYGSAEWDNWVAGHELDWLAVEASEERTSEETLIEGTSKDDLSKKQIPMGGVLKETRQKGYIWHITGQYEDATTSKDEADKDLATTGKDEAGKNVVETGKDETGKNLLFHNRIRLSHLTGHCPINEEKSEDYQRWEDERVKVRRKAKDLGAAVSHAAVTLLRDSTIKGTIELKVKIMVENFAPLIHEEDPFQREAPALYQSLETISIKIKTPKGLDHVNWRTDSSQLEAALGLWYWSMSSNKGTMMEIISASFRDQKWDNSIEADMNLWQGSSHLKYEKLSLRKKKGTFEEDDPYINIQGFWINANEDLLLDMCVQELYATLLHSLKSLDFREIEVKTMTICEAGWNLQINDTVITALASSFRDNNLGTYSDAISCIMPLLRSQLHSYHDSLLSMLVQAAKDYRRNEEWPRAERVLRWACEYNYEKNTQENKDVALQELGELYRRAFESGAKSQREFGKNGIEWMVSEFKDNEISTRYKDIAKKINTDNAIYQWPASRFSEAINERRREDALSHLCFTKPGDFNSDKLGKCLPLAARNGWSEVVTTLLEMKVKPDMQDEDGRTAASYFAELGQERSLQQLIDEDADLNMADHTDLTPLMYAIKKEKTNTVMKLLNTARVDCNRRMTNGRSALWFAVELNSIKIMAELLGNGDGINQEDDYRVSPLFLAAKKGHKDAVELLIKRGAAVDQKDNSQATPLIWAMWRGHAEIAKLLLKALGKKEQRDSMRDQIAEAKSLLGCTNQIDRIRNHSDGFCSTLDIRPKLTLKETDQQRIDFDPPYSRAPRIMLGISSIHMKWRSNCRVQWEASDVTEKQLELTRTGSNDHNPNSSKGSNLAVKSSSVVWIEFESHEDDFQGMAWSK